MRYLSFSLAVVLLTALTAPAQAAVVGISSVTFDDPGILTPIVNNANLTSITAGATTYTLLTGATSATGVTSATLGAAFFPVNGTDPGNGIAAIEDGLDATTGTNGIGNGVNIDFEQNVDGANLFVVDLGGEDTYSITPLDSSGNAIGDFILTGVASGGGLSFATETFTGAGDVTTSLRGIVFNTNDFAGTGTLTGVEGIRLLGAALDVTSVGIASGVVVPEPSSLAVLFVGACGFVSRRRSSRSSN